MEIIILSVMKCAPEVTFVSFRSITTRPSQAVTETRNLLRFMSRFVKNVLIVALEKPESSEPARIILISDSLFPVPLRPCVCPMSFRRQFVTLLGGSHFHRTHLWRCVNIAKAGGEPWQNTRWRLY